jgi:hypothetical protein
MSTLTSAIALTTGGVLTSAGYSSSQVPQVVFTLALLSGVFMTVLGLLKWGKVVNFVSNAVMTGFVMGVAVLITVGKFDDIFGYKPSGFSNKVVEALDILVHPGDWSRGRASGQPSPTRRAPPRRPRATSWARVWATSPTRPSSRHPPVDRSRGQQSRLSAVE